MVEDEDTGGSIMTGVIGVVLLVAHVAWPKQFVVSMFWVVVVDFLQELAVRLVQDPGIPGRISQLQIS